MANKPARPLTLDEARVRLRLAARHASPLVLIQQHPWQTTGLALIGGFIIGQTHLQSILSNRRVAPLLWRLLNSI